MIYTIIISALTVLVVILGYTTFNLLRKNEKQEDVLVGYMEYLDRLSRVIEASDQKLKEVDAKEFFISQGLKIKTKIFKDCEHRIHVEGLSLGLAFLRKNLL